MPQEAAPEVGPEATGRFPVAVALPEGWAEVTVPLEPGRLTLELGERAPGTDDGATGELPPRVAVELDLELEGAGTMVTVTGVVVCPPWQDLQATVVVTV